MLLLWKYWKIVNVYLFGIDRIIQLSQILRRIETTGHFGSTSTETFPLLGKGQRDWQPGKLHVHGQISKRFISHW